MNGIRREQCLMAHPDIVLGSALLTKVLQGDSQPGNSYPCRECRRFYSEAMVTELHLGLQKLYEALMGIKALLVRASDQGK